MTEFAKLETRLNKLESDYSKEVASMLAILQKIEQRLVGALDQESPGIISEVRQLKVGAEDVKKTLVEIAVEFKAIKELQLQDAKISADLAEMKSQLPKIWSKIQTYERYRYIILGALFILGFMANKGWELYMAAAKKP